MAGEKRGMVSVANVFSKPCCGEEKNGAVAGQGWERKRRAFNDGRLFVNGGD